MASEDMLTDEELALLNNLAYISKSSIMPKGYGAVWSGEYENRDMTLGQVISDVVESNGGLTEITKHGTMIDGSHVSAQEWARMLEEAMTNEKIANLKYADVDSYSKDGSLAFVLTSDEYTYVIFKGTGSDEVGSEWPDNIRGLNQSDTSAQRAALDYLYFVDARFGGELVVSGHSKGANKAMYTTIVSGLVSRCVAFDGQGFGTSFLSQYANEIASNKTLIWAYNLESDFVSPLLSTIAGVVTYLEGNRLDGDFLKNHSPSALLDDSFGFREGTQSAFSKELNNFSLYILDSTPDAQLEKITNFLVPLIDEALGGSGGIGADQIVKIIGGDPEGFATLLVCLTEYPNYSNLISSLVDNGLLSAGTKKFLDKWLFIVGLKGNSFMHLITLMSEMGIPGYDSAWAKTFLNTYWEAKEAIGPGSGSLSSVLMVAGSSVVRDFTMVKRMELLEIVKEVENESWFDPFKWDIWYRVESWADRLTLDNYQHNMTEYFRKSIDINAASEADINDIFNRAEERDSSFSAVIGNISESMQYASGKCNDILSG